MPASRAGVERSENDYLTGSNTDLAGGFSQLVGALKGEVVQGDDVILSLSAAARVANQAAQK